MKSWVVSKPILMPLVLICLHADPALAEQPRHERLTAAAWEAFNKREYEEAIRQADLCIDDFRGDAARKQKDLDEKKERIPSGRVNDQQKRAIFKNGVLNDVATCYFIKGRSAHQLGQREVSAKAMTTAAKYPAARAWDQRGWFWSPAEAAKRFLKNPELADKAPHEIYTAEAWAAFNQGLHAEAIRHADKCISEFHEAALEMENDLTKRNVRLPTGEVDEATKKRIFENGLLNDVATCLFIKGKAAEAMRDRKTAVEAYRDATKLPHGRCWDPNGWFWAPAEGSGDRLEILR